MSRRKEHTRHHYNPQCYLRNFTEDGKCVWAYDKARSKSYHTAIFSIWNLYITTGDYFFTSDFPISVEPHVKDAQQECTGLAQYGGVVTFPISKKILLKIWDYRYFNDCEKSDGRCYIAEPGFVRQENIRQYLYAREIVVSANNNLSFLSFIKQIDGSEVSEHPNYGFTSNWI